MIKELITALRASGHHPDAVDIADMLWLAAAMDAERSIPESSDLPDASDIEPDTEQPTSTDAHRQSQAPASQDLEPDSSRLEPRTRPHATARHVMPSAEPVEHIAAPTSPALPERLDIARALRPFMRHRDSDHFSHVDIEATVERFANTGFLYPVMQPDKERWFDVALIVDESLSMVVWEDTVEEIVSVFMRQGAFRDVHRWSLREEHGRAVIRNEEGRPTGVDNVVDPGGRRLVLMVTDCVAECWYRPTLWQLLQRWGKQTPVAILQMLPTRMWPSTGLGLANIDYRGSRPGAPNSQHHFDMPFWVESTDAEHGLEAIPIPAVSLDAQAVAEWANVTMGSGSISGRAVVKTTVDGAYPDNDDQESWTAEERLASFRANASVDAWRLTAFLSVAPLRLDVMRLVQEVMMPHTGHAELAEFLIGGLVKRVDEVHAGADDQSIVFEFVEGVRERLNRDVDRSQTLKVYRNIAYHLERTEGSAPGFSALILGQDIDAEAVPEFLKPFVTVGHGVLQRMGLVDFDPGSVMFPTQERDTPKVSDTPSSEVPPVWDAALVLSGYQSNTLDFKENPKKSARDFRAWLTSSPGPSMASKRVVVPLETTDIQALVQQLMDLWEQSDYSGSWDKDFSGTGPPNKRPILVLAFFGRMIELSEEVYFCLPGYNPRDNRPDYLVNINALVGTLKRLEIWRDILIVSDGGPEDFMVVTRPHLVVHAEKVLLSQPDYSQLVLLARKPEYREPFLPKLINAINFGARELDGTLRVDELARTLKDFAYVESKSSGFSLLLDAESEVLPESAMNQPAPPGLSAALVVGTGDVESLFDAGLITTWLRHPDGFDLNPDHVWQLSDPEASGTVYEALEKLDADVQNGATLFVFVAGEVVMREDGIYLKLNDHRSDAFVRLRDLSDRLGQVHSFSSVVFMMSLLSNESVQFDLSTVLSEKEDPVTPVFYMICRDRERHRFVRAVIDCFARAPGDILEKGPSSESDPSIITTKTLVDLLLELNDLRVWTNDIEPIPLGPPHVGSTSRVRVLSRRSRFMCEHGRGRVVLPDGSGPLTGRVLSGAPIEGCTLEGDTGQPCTRVAGFDGGGTGGTLGPGRSSLVFDTVRVFSDGVPASYVDEREHELDPSESASVFLDNASYLDLTSLSAYEVERLNRSLDEPRTESESYVPQQEQSINIDTKWPVVTLSLDFFATSTGSSLLLRRPRLQQDFALLFGLGGDRSTFQRLSSRFEFLANSKAGQERFKVDVLALNRPSHYRFDSMLSFLKDNMDQTSSSRRAPFLTIEDIWLSNTGSRIVDYQSDEGNGNNQTELFNVMPEFLKELNKLGVKHNGMFDQQTIGRWQEFQMGGNVNITALGPDPKQNDNVMEVEFELTPSNDALVLMVGCEKYRVLLTPDSDDWELDQVFNRLSFRSKGERVDVWQLPSPSLSRFTFRSGFDNEQLFRRVRADHYLIAGNGEYATEWTVEMLKALLAMRSDERSFNVHFAFPRKHMYARFPLQEVEALFDRHATGNLVFAERDAGYITVDLLMSMPGPDEQRRQQQQQQ